MIVAVAVVTVTSALTTHDTILSSLFPFFASQCPLFLMTYSGKEKEAKYYFNGLERERERRENEIKWAINCVSSLIFILLFFV